MANYSRLAVIDCSTVLDPKIYITKQHKGQRLILPGGEGKEGEDEYDTLLRELKEEGKFPYDLWSLAWGNYMELSFPWGINNENLDYIFVMLHTKQVDINSNKDRSTNGFGFVSIQLLIESYLAGEANLPENVLNELLYIRTEYWTDLELTMKKPSEEFYLGKEPMYPWQNY